MTFSFGLQAACLGQRGRGGRGCVHDRLHVRVRDLLRRRDYVHHLQRHAHVHGLLQLI